MKNLSDDRLEKMLTDYMEAEPQQSFVYDPDRKEEKIIPFARYRKQLAAVASLVLVSVLSLVLYFSIGNKINTPIAVAPSSQSATTPSARGEGSGGAIPNESPDGSEDEKSPSALRQLIDSIFGKSDETQNSASPTTVMPTENSRGGAIAQPTEASRRNPPQSATEKTGVTPSESGQQPAQPPVTPTDPERPPVAPTEWDPELIEPTDPPGEGGTPQDPDPTEGDEPGYEKPAPIDFYEWSDLSRLPEDRVIYCKIYDNYGRLLGSGNLYDSEHVAQIERITGDRALLRYTTPEDMIWYSDYYNYVFYDQNGKLLAQGQEYVHI